MGAFGSCFVSLVFLVQLTHSQSENRTCYWYGFRAGSVRGELYISGGDRNDVPSTQSPLKDDPFALHMETSRSLFTMNYSVAFDLEQGPPDLGKLFQTAQVGSSQDFPGDKEGTILASSIELYAFGGLGSLRPLRDTLVNYQVYNEPGQRIFNEGPQTSYEFPPGSDVSNGSSASVPVDNQRQAFYFSGMQTPNSTVLVESDGRDLVPARSLIIADLTVQGKATWENLTLPRQVPPRARSQLLWIPRGREGLLVAIGGLPYPLDIFTPPTDAQIKANQVVGAAVMKTISIFDIAGRIWHQQNTTGDIPDPLEGFCAVLAQQEDLNEFEIYIYGGSQSSADLQSEPATDAVYTLSLPSFTWVEITKGNSSHARTRHSCTTPFPDQMLVIGGWPNTASCIHDDSILDVFNLNALAWTHRFDPLRYEPYQRPEKITNKIASAIRSQTVLDDLYALFEEKYPEPIPTYYPDAQQKPKDKHLGAIIGGSVTSALLLSLVGFILWYYRPAKRRARSQCESAVSTPNASRIARWLKGTQQPLFEPKSVLLDGTTEVDSVAPGGTGPPAELDARARTTSLAGVPQAELEQSSFSGTLLPSMANSASGRLCSRSRSPSSQQTESVEAAGAPLHEVHGNSKPMPQRPRASETVERQSPAYMTEHSMYPWTVDWNPTAPRARHGLGSVDQGPLHPSRPVDAIPNLARQHGRQVNSVSSPTDQPPAYAQPEQGLSPKPNSSVQATPIDLLFARVQSAEAFHRISTDTSVTDISNPAENSNAPKRDSVVSPIMQQQDLLPSSDRPYFSSISSSVLGMEDLPTSVHSQQQPRTPMDSLAHVIEQDDPHEEDGGRDFVSAAAGDRGRSGGSSNPPAAL